MKSTHTNNYIGHGEDPDHRWGDAALAITQKA